MNITAQCCALVIIVTLFIFNNINKRKLLSTDKAFNLVLAICFLNLCFDIGSIVCIKYKDVLPILLVNFVCKTYLFCIISTVLVAIYYLFTNIYLKFKKIKNYIILSTSIAVLYAFSLIFLPIEYIYEDGGKIVYSQGLANDLTYVLGFIIISFFIVILHVKRNVLSYHKYTIIRLWILFWFIAPIIQFFYKELLIVGIYLTLGTMLIYLELENPDSKKNLKTNLYSLGFLKQFIEYNLKNNIPFYANIIYLGNSNIHIQESALLEIQSFLVKLNNVIVNKYKNNFIIITDNQENFDITTRSIEERFEQGWGRYNSLVNLNHAIVSESSIFNSSEHFFFIIKSCEEYFNSQNTGEILTIGQDIVNNYKKKLDIEDILNKALEKDWIKVYYQPIYSTKEGKFTSAEALVRIIDDNNVMYPPFEFITIAEQNGLIIKLGEIIFTKVCKFLSESKLKNLGIEYVEVNLSTVQCGCESLADDFIAIMEKYGVSPSQINLEITESASITTKKILLNNMKKLMDYGVTFSLDDFGTGHSNLNYIAEMPVDIVKFDRGMTQSYFNSKKAQYVMNAAISMINGMKLKIVSEGIENKEQFEIIKDLVDYIQGFFFSKPLPQENFVEFVKEKNCNEEDATNTIIKHF